MLGTDSRHRFFSENPLVRIRATTESPDGLDGILKFVKQEIRGTGRLAGHYAYWVGVVSVKWWGEDGLRRIEAAFPEGFEIHLPE